MCLGVVAGSRNQTFDFWCSIRLCNPPGASRLMLINNRQLLHPHLFQPPNLWNSQSISQKRLKMFQTIQLKAVCLKFLFLCAYVQSSPSLKAPEYQRLPPLREQAAIQDAWRDQRVSTIPHILQKYGVDAWLVCRFPLSNSSR